MSLRLLLFCFLCGPAFNALSAEIFSYIKTISAFSVIPFKYKGCNGASNGKKCLDQVQSMGSKFCISMQIRKEVDYEGKKLTIKSKHII